MQGKSNGSSGKPIAAMVLGIIAIIAGCLSPLISIICAIVSIVLGIEPIKEDDEGKGMAMAGRVCSIIALILSGIMIVAGTVILSALGLAGLY